MSVIQKNDYSKIKFYIRKKDGTELSDQEIRKILLNTELYKAILVDGVDALYKCYPNYLNPYMSNIYYSFKAVNGDLINISLDYNRDYFVTNNIKESNRKLKKYKTANDWQNGKPINYNDIKTDSKADFKFYSFIKDDNNQFYLQIYENTEEDIKLTLLKRIDEIYDWLKNKNSNYNMEWNNDYSQINVYSDESDTIILNGYNKFEIIFCSIMYQTINGNGDWHSTINYYNYNTKELIKQEIFR